MENREKKQKEFKDVSVPLYLFHQGTNFTAYDFLGVHAEEEKEGCAYVFRVWAPGADEVRVIGDFSGWSEGVTLEKLPDSGVWEGRLKSACSLEGTFYKYAIRRGDRVFLKADPYALSQQTLTETASVIRTAIPYRWTDGTWMRERGKRLGLSSQKKNPHFCSAPVHIYEMHLGSWQTAPSSEGERWLGYRELADRLAGYLPDMGYTHVELMPVMEHPFDGSWGYQICGYYAPTARYGSPEDFKYFVDRLHGAGIGVILDWVPAHFPKDAHGLYEFDGGPLYEYQGWDRMENRGWGTRCFDVGRPEVQSFLVSNALFWLREYHVDGLRVDAVASMLYLDYDRAPGEWFPNYEGNNKSLEAVAFFQKLNTAVFGEFSDVLVVAEESTDWPLLTKPVSMGGLGFNFKWNMGFANDLFQYVGTDPIYRQWMHNKLTFPMVYAFAENYILPISHDEVVHEKGSLIAKMFGSYEEKFATMRAFLTYMMTMPGKKLTFMGTEFAQFREWDFRHGLEWFLLDFETHRRMQNFVRTLNRLYLDTPALWEIDDGWDGFQWIDPDNAPEGILSYRRIDRRGRETVVLLNFTPVRRESVRVPVPKMGRYREILTTDQRAFGGSGWENGERKTVTEQRGDGGKENVLYLTLPPLSGILLSKVTPPKKSRPMNPEDPQYT